MKRAFVLDERAFVVLDARAFALEYGALVQPIAFGVSLNLNLRSQCHWSLFNEAWQKRPMR